METAFIAQVAIPTVVDKSGNPIAADPNYLAPTEDNSEYSKYIFLPNRQEVAANTQGGPTLYHADLPFFLYWATNSPEKIGTVHWTMYGTPHTNVNPPKANSQDPTNSISSATKKAINTGGPEGEPIEFEFEKVVGGVEYLPLTLTLELNFSDSKILPGETVLRSQLKCVIPNQNHDNLQEVVEITDTVWGGGLELSNSLAPNGSAIYDMAKAWAGTQAKVALKDDQLVEDAVIKGISAFKDPLDTNRPLKVSGRTVYTGAAGPTIRTKSPGESVRTPTSTSTPTPPKKILDSFETADPLEPYTVTKSYRGTPEVTSNESQHGDRSLHLEASSGQSRNSKLYSTAGDGLNAYPQPGSTVQTWFKTDRTNGGLSVYIGGQDPQNSYRIHTGFADEKLHLMELSGGDKEIVEGTGYTYSAGTWYQLIIDWGANGSLTAELQSADRTAPETISLTSTRYSEGLIGFGRWSGGPDVNGWVDNVVLI